MLRHVWKKEKKNTYIVVWLINLHSFLTTVGIDIATVCVFVQTIDEVRMLDIIVIIIQLVFGAYIKTVISKL